MPPDHVSAVMRRWRVQACAPSRNTSVPAMANYQATPGIASPIENRIGQVFIPVRDMPRAIAWYSKILGLPTGQASHGDTIYDLQAQGETRLALDANKPDFDTSGPARFFFWTEDIRACLAFLQRHDVPIEGQIEDIGAVSFLQFRDPDGNPLMVCQRN
jgi:catechol 2,3-dioxygenase-like lactoylglutathione lyase family enzyme